MEKDGFEELRKTLAHAQEILSQEFPGMMKNFAEPVVGRETPLDAVIYIPGFGTMSREILMKEIWKRIEEATHKAISTSKDYNLVEVYHALYHSGVLKAMIETAIKHEGLEL